jgi:hypothetical protein
MVKTDIVLLQYLLNTKVRLPSNLALEISKALGDKQTQTLLDAYLGSLLIPPLISLVKQPISNSRDLSLSPFSYRSSSKGRGKNHRQGTRDRTAFTLLTTIIKRLKRSELLSKI